MISLFGSIIGFISSIFPELLRISQSKIDRKYDLDLLNKQLEIKKITESAKLEFAEISADIEENRILRGDNIRRQITITDSLNNSVRPILAYGFFFLYGLIKFTKYFLIEKNFFDLGSLEILWDDEDQAIFAAIIGFYFGQRSFSKFRKIK